MQHSNTAGCILLKFYIKPQHTANVYNLLYVVSYRNSTSNHNTSANEEGQRIVVSYRNSTSNHNSASGIASATLVVSYRNSTSNHNSAFATALVIPLYLIEILHQTTTYRKKQLGRGSCILSKFYIKPQQKQRHSTSEACCILSKFYIKPQHHDVLPCAFVVVSYRNSTSNHNTEAATTSDSYVVSYRNSTSNHNYIALPLRTAEVVSYRNSTSNHNSVRCYVSYALLYLIEILHQTTT